MVEVRWMCRIVRFPVFLATSSLFWVALAEKLIQVHHRPTRVTFLTIATHEPFFVFFLFQLKPQPQPQQQQDNKTHKTRNNIHTRRMSQRIAIGSTVVLGVSAVVMGFTPPTSLVVTRQTDSATATATSTTALGVVVDPTTISKKDYEAIKGDVIPEEEMMKIWEAESPFLYHKHVDVIQDIAPIADEMVDKIVSTRIVSKERERETDACSRLCVFFLACFLSHSLFDELGCFLVGGKRGKKQKAWIIV